MVFARVNMAVRHGRCAFVSASVQPPVPSFVDRQLLADRQVRFAGYMQPHPLENKIHIKVSRCLPRPWLLFILP